MVKNFVIEKIHAGLIPKATLFKILKYIDKNLINTPVLLLDKELLLQKASIIGKNISNSRVFYALKANPDYGVAKTLRDFDIGFEIASEGELIIMEALGVPPSKIITSNPIKSIKFLKMANEYGIKLMAFDSRDEVDKIAMYAPGTKLYIRLSVPNEGSEWPLSKKFGVEIEEAIDMLLYAKKKGLIPAGITFHVGSQCTNLYNWNIAIDKAKILWEMAADKGIALSLLNIGGGYPVNYTKMVLNIETIEKSIEKLIKEKFPSDIEVHIEPGRSIVGDSGIMVASIVGKAKRKDEYWLYMDVGVFNGLMESLGGIKYSYIIESYEETRREWTLAGPSCDSFDIVDKNVALHEPDIGNLILILSSGAYTVSYASEFNGFQIPKTVLI